MALCLQVLLSHRLVLRSVRADKRACDANWCWGLNGGSQENAIENPYQNLGNPNEPSRRVNEGVDGKSDGFGVHKEVPARAPAALTQYQFSTTSSAGILI